MGPGLYENQLLTGILQLPLQFSHRLLKKCAVPAESLGSVACVFLGPTSPGIPAPCVCTRACSRTCMWWCMGMSAWRPEARGLVLLFLRSHPCLLFFYCIFIYSSTLHVCGCGEATEWAVEVRGQLGVILLPPSGLVASSFTYWAISAAPPSVLGLSQEERRLPGGARLAGLTLKSSLGHMQPVSYQLAPPRALTSPLSLEQLWFTLKTQPRHQLQGALLTAKAARAFPVCPPQIPAACLCLWSPILFVLF